MSYYDTIAQVICCMVVFVEVISNWVTQSVVNRRFSAIEACSHALTQMCMCTHTYDFQAFRPKQENYDKLTLLD